METTEELCVLSWIIPGSKILPVSHLIKKTKVKQTSHCWRSSDELERDVLLWSLADGRANVDRPANTYLNKYYTDTDSKLDVGTLDNLDG